MAPESRSRSFLEAADTLLVHHRRNVLKKADSLIVM